MTKVQTWVQLPGYNPIIWKVVKTSVPNLAIAFSTRIYVKKPIEVIITMAENNADGEPFQLVTTKQTHKKPCHNPQEHPVINHQYVTPLRMTFKIPAKSSTKFALAANVKQVIHAMLYYDETLAFVAFDGISDNSTLYVKHDQFPDTKETFKEYFQVHAMSSKTPVKNTVTVGCIMHSTCPIAEIKYGMTKSHSMFEWLSQWCTFITADTLGHATTRVIGHLFHLHPRVTHHTTLHDKLSEHLSTIPIKPKEALLLAPHTNMHYKQAMDSGDDTMTYMPAFKLFPTKVSSGKNPTQVTTKTMGIKCSTEDSNLLHELFTRAFTIPAPNIAHIQFVPSGIATQIGLDKYQTMIYENNKFLTNGTAITVGGITSHTLELKIKVNNPGKPTWQMTVQEIFMELPWCHQVEITQKLNRILLVMEKWHLIEARGWLDDNLEGLFTWYLTQNPAYHPDEEYNVPQRLDKIPTTQAGATYADALSQKYQTASTSPTTATQYQKPPPQTNRKITLFTFDAKEFPLLNTDDNNNHSTMDKQKPHTQMNDNATVMTTTSTATTPIDLEALQREIKKSIQDSLKTLVQHEIQPLRQEFQASHNLMIQKQEQLSSTVELLQVRLTQIMKFFEKSSSSTKGDDHA